MTTLLAIGRCGLPRSLVGVALGITSLVGPVVYSPPSAPYDSPLLPIVRTAVEQMSPATFLLLFLSGLILGLLRSAPICAAATILWLPVVAVAEMLVDATSHNLWPMEFVIYALLSVVRIVGTFVGSRVRPAVGVATR
jgi:hypothetical protein